jgi:hypothetical protein
MIVFVMQSSRIAIFEMKFPPCVLAWRSLVVETFTSLSMRTSKRGDGLNKILLLMEISLLNTSNRFLGPSDRIDLFKSNY